jgi:hypothetical protein
MDDFDPYYDDDDGRSVILVSERGANSRRVTASMSDNGLVISGQDMGPLVEMIFNDDDYEFWYTVPTDQLSEFARRIGAKPDTILQTLKAKWSGARFEDLEEILRDPTMKVRFDSY